MLLNGRENYKSFCKGMSSVVFAMPNTTSIWIVVTISPMKQIIAGHPCPTSMDTWLMGKVSGSSDSTRNTVISQRGNLHHMYHL